MAEIVTRDVGETAKGSPLTNQEVDNNFINLNTELEATTAAVAAGQDNTIAYAIALG